MEERQFPRKGMPDDSHLLAFFSDRTGRPLVPSKFRSSKNRVHVRAERQQKVITSQ